MTATASKTDAGNQDMVIQVNAEGQQPGPWDV